MAKIVCQGLVLLGGKFLLTYFRIGSGPRSEINNNKALVPGVGQYSIDRTFNIGPKYSMRPRTHNIDTTTCSPGPGNYTPNFNIEHRSTEKFTMRPKTGNPTGSKGLNPGPGQYQIRTNKDLQTSTYVFGKEKKIKEEEGTFKYTPGPGNYNIEEMNGTQCAAPKFSFGKEDRQKSASQMRPKTPGPGQYNTNSLLGNNAPKISMSFVRPEIGMGTNKYTPGPGQYSLTSSNMNKAPQYK